MIGSGTWTPCRSSGSRRRRFLCCVRKKGGAEGRNRTADTTIFSRMLYRLSYLGTEAKCILRGLFAPVKVSMSDGRAYAFSVVCTDFL
jgi:hypothetical protein